MCFSINLKIQNKYLGFNVIAISVMLFFQSTLLNAEEQLAQCFPSESAWGVIKLSRLPQQSENENKQKLNISFRKSAMYLPSFYGFAYLKSESVNVPKVTDQALVKKYFLDMNLTELDKNSTSPKESDQYYGFTPGSTGTWVVYLVASLNKIPFLETKGLRIYPDIERQRGGTVFSGASLGLTETVDFKACLIPSK